MSATEPERPRVSRMRLVVEAPDHGGERPATADRAAHRMPSVTRWYQQGWLTASMH